MSKLPVLKPKEVIKALERAGFIFIRQKGSHRIYRKERILLTVPYHSKELKPKTLHQIIKQAGLSREEFVKFF